MAGVLAAGVVAGVAGAAGGYILSEKRFNAINQELQNELTEEQERNQTLAEMYAESAKTIDAKNKVIAQLEEDIEQNLADLNAKSKEIAAKEVEISTLTKEKASLTR